MGLRIKIVRLSEKRIAVRDLDPNREYLNLKCGYCNADVSFVCTHKKQSREKEFIVQQHCRLKQGCNHNSNCKYNVDGNLKIINATCADRDLMGEDGAIFYLRLLLITEDEFTFNKDNMASSKVQDDSRKNYISNGKKTAYLSTLKKVIQLRTEVEKNSELEDKVKLRWFDSKGHLIVISWGQFYFDFEYDYAKLYKWLNGKYINHPICIAGQIKEIKALEDNGYCINLIGRHLNRDELFIPEIYFKSKEIYDKYKFISNDRIVVFGSFRLRNPKQCNAKTYYNLSCNICDANQMLILKNNDVI